MLIDDLQKIIDEGRVANKPLEYLKIELKEALIMRTLDFIYNSPRYSKLIFTGGTALKIIGKTNRLSEDLDMDYNGREIDLNKMGADVAWYFKNYGFDDLKYTVRAKNKILTIKFPVLLKLALANNAKNESDLLYLKIELEKNKYKAYDIALTSIMKDNVFLVVRHYDLPTLFANKIGAILGRRGKIFYDKYDFKGRDFYDLIWFLENKIKPNLKRTKAILKKEQNIEIKDLSDVWNLLRHRIEKIETKGIYEDMKNLTTSGASIKVLSKNYSEIFESLISAL
ncbi:MAG: hypothetical protein UR66_C0013G0029 [Candidatus Moranbacteria bacterium GW2011_GWE1_35_17]|nr:MAG: hypothetical protein UR66_C0013G0029 [Candidatus Moranbacteria bacterium GW2011_GWE1_35_17]KKP81282.1 MAG: hypothetical protein UR82_C0068G0007 [Candidatus Moranbacteria bacterium GW2011_GWF1_35_5]KKP82128.1 MAG: hypothetical protein UR83_C0057G0006 [Candidatus Moranbacteria bacterium GW2011_GWF2_35_54]